MRERFILKKAGVFSVIAVLLLTVASMTGSTRNDTTQSVTTCVPIDDPINYTFKGGFGLTIVITNTGNQTMEHMSYGYYINLTRSPIIFGGIKDVTNITLAPGASTKIRAIPFSIGGIGKVEIFVIYYMPDEYVYEYQEKIVMIGPFILPLG